MAYFIVVAEVVDFLVWGQVYVVQHLADSLSICPNHISVELTVGFLSISVFERKENAICEVGLESHRTPRI